MITYTLTDFLTTDSPNLSTLLNEIKTAGIVAKRVTAEDTNYYVHVDDLSVDELSTLDNIIAAHTGADILTADVTEFINGPFVSNKEHFFRAGQFLYDGTIYRGIKRINCITRSDAGVTNAMIVLWDNQAGVTLAQASFNNINSTVIELELLNQPSDSVDVISIRLCRTALSSSNYVYVDNIELVLEKM